MRVLHVINSLDIGGAERRVIDAAHALRDHGHEISIVTLLPPGLLAREVSAVSLSSLHVATPRDLALASLRLAFRLRRSPVDIVHTHLVQAGLVGRLAAVLAGHRAIVSTQHNAFWPGERRPVYRAERYTWALSTCFIALSDAIAKHLRRGGCRRPIHIIPTGIDLNAYRRIRPARVAKATLSIPPSSTVIGVVAALREQKGHKYLLAAVAQIAPAFPGLQVLLVGTGPLYEQMVDEVSRLSLSGVVRLLGPALDVPAIMEALDVLVLPSLWEGFGRVLLEAMAIGVPVVATAVEGIAEIVDDHSTGLLVPAGDAGRLAEAITNTLRDPASAEDRARRAQQMVRTSFTISRMACAEAAVYRTAQTSTSTA